MFVIATFASAFLIFLVQPMVGKRILPWFGGAPGVWTLCLAFYQTTLFAGYAYAHFLIRFVKPSLQPIVHAIVFAALCWFCRSCPVRAGSQKVRLRRSGRSPPCLVRTSHCLF